MTREEASEAWIDELPEDTYGLCPCGCGSKMRFLIKAGEEVLEQHYEKFIEKKMKESVDKSTAIV